MALQQTSVEVSFATYEDDGQGGGPLLEISSKRPESDQVVYFRAHGAQDCVLFSTSGSLNRDSRGLFKFTSEFLHFSNSSIQSLRYPQARGTGMKIALQGNFLLKDGTIVPQPVVRFDAAKNAIVCDSGSVYGIVLVEYRAPYELWRAKFGGVCPSIIRDDPPVNATLGNPDDDREYEGRLPMLVLAVKDAEVKASLSLTPQACDANRMSIADMGKGAGPPKMKVEIDPQYKPKYVRNNQVFPPVQAHCKLRLFPSMSGSLKVNKGKVSPTGESGYAQVTQLISFNGSSSAKLDYQPAGSLSLTLQTVFKDAWGQVFSPDFKTLGEQITVVNWIDKRKFTDPYDRVVEIDEVAVADMFGNARPCYGTVEVSYTASYDLYDLYFEYKTVTEGFEPAFVVPVPTFGDDSGEHILVPPPSIKGAT